MGESSDYTAQEQAQAIIDLTADVSAEFGWSTECSIGYDAARRLYEEHGPFELSWGYGTTPPAWYSDSEAADG